MTIPSILPRILSEKNLEVSFKEEILRTLLPNSDQKVAILVTCEYEGIFQNGGVGTYYKRLSEQLTRTGWYVILLLCQTEKKFEGKSHIPAVHHIFSTHEVRETLILQPTHQVILKKLNFGSFDSQSYSCFLFAQALTQGLSKSKIYIEFHEMFGFGYHTIQAKQTHVLPERCVTAVTLHSGHEWLYEASEAYADAYPNEFGHLCDYEQYTFEHSDLAFFPSYHLKARVEAYGWNTSHAKHMPNFIPISTSQGDGSTGKVPTSNKIPIVFFGRLERRKGLCTFVEAIQQLNSEVRNQIQVYFIGKPVAIHTPNLHYLTSDLYIEQTLKDCVDIQIFPKFYSQEAIEFITNLGHPIVCLCSPQENFPNSGLEMGQLPVSLVVSSTGGFHETLALVNRSTGIHWFKPEKVASLAEMLSKAIAQHPEEVSVASKEALNHLNQDLMTQKANWIENTFQIVQTEENTQQNEKVNQPRVTIGITCYKLGKYLVECLTSVEAQTYSNLDVIVIDDASPDQETQEHIVHAQSLFPTYKFLRAETNLGLGGARNRLIEMAEGEYFLPLDADNRLLPFAVEKYVEAAHKSGAAIVITPLLAFEAVSSIHNFRRCSLAQLLQMNLVGDACSLFSTELLRKFKHPERHDCSTHDWCIISTAIATDEKVVHYPYPLYEYRQRPDSMIKSASITKERYYLRQYLAQIPPANWSPRQLYMLMTGVQQLNAQLSASQAQTAAAKAELKEVRQRLRLLRARKEAAEKELEQSQSRIAAMETSKFWKFRKGWFKLKRMLGSSAEN